MTLQPKAAAFMASATETPPPPSRTSRELQVVGEERGEEGEEKRRWRVRVGGEDEKVKQRRLRGEMMERWRRRRRRSKLKGRRKRRKGR